MVNEYLNKIQVSKHFFSNEFRCQCCNRMLVNFNLLEMLENIFSHFNCSKAIITSGFRCPSYSVKVGGTKTDQHTKGNAVDIIFYDINGKPIDTKLISCYAQDIGFGGIARISDKAIHLDVRTGARYLGDEMKGGTNTVTNDFYTYYKISRPQSDIDKAIDILFNKSIINSPNFWKENYNTDEGKKYFKDMIIKFANYIK